MAPTCFNNLIINPRKRGNLSEDEELALEIETQTYKYYPGVYVGEVSEEDKSDSETEVLVLRQPEPSVPSVTLDTVTRDNSVPTVCVDELDELHTDPVWDVRKVFEPDEEGDTLVHLVALNGDSDTLRKLLRIAPSHWDLDTRNLLGQTPLMMATIAGNSECCRLLVAGGARVDLQDTRGLTALHHACARGDLSCVEALSRPVTRHEVQDAPYRVPHQCIPQNPQTLDYSGSTCLHLAAARGHLSVLRHLLLDPLHVDVNLTDGKSGRTVLHQAVEARNESVLRFLLENRGHLMLDLSPENYAGQTPLDLARAHCYGNTERLLFDRGARTGWWAEVDDNMDGEKNGECHAGGGAG